MAENENKLLQTLEEMGAEVDDVLDRLDGDTELYLSCLSKLVSDQSIVTLRQAVADKDDKTGERAVHTLKGMALNLGLLPLADASMDMLLDYRGGDPAAARAQLPEVETALKVWTDAIQRAGL